MKLRPLPPTVWLGFILFLLLILMWLTYLVDARAEEGGASWYAHGSRTASGQRFNPYALTCAHRTAAFGSQLRVVDLATGRSITCTCNDRGPFVRGRVIDLSLGAARALGIVGRGVARVRVTRR